MQKLRFDEETFVVGLLYLALAVCSLLLPVLCVTEKLLGLGERQ